MSLQDISSPPIEPWSNFYINSINTNQITAGTINGNPVIHNIEGPLTISANVASGQPILKIVTENSGSGNSNVAVATSNFDSSAVVQLLTTNQPSPSNALVALVGNLLFTTFGSIGENHIQFYPGVTLALDLKTTGSGQTLTSIQNTQLYGSAVSGYVASTLNYYEEYGPVAYTFSGPFSPATYTRNITITRIGRMVTLKIQSLSQVAQVRVPISVSPALPARFVPAVSGDTLYNQFPITIIQNNTDSLGQLTIDGAGNINIYASLITTSPSSYITYTGDWFTTVNCGFENISISYSV
jgi:hypothetical protein